MVPNALDTSCHLPPILAQVSRYVPMLDLSVVPALTLLM
jgi:hypothetical protein